MIERRELTTRKEVKEREKVEIQRNFEPKLPTIAEPYQGYRGYQTANEENILQLMDYWRAIRKRLWLVIGIAILVTTLTAIYMSRRPNIYAAKARVQIDLEQVNPELVSSERRSPIVNSDPAYFNTQLQNLTNPSLLRRVVKETNLENNKDFVVTNKDASRSGWRGLLRNIGITGDDKKAVSGDSVPVATGSSVTISGSEDLAEAKRLAPYVEALQKELNVDPVRESRSVFKDTRLIDISFRNTNPDLAALIVNTIADVFTKSNQEKKSKTSGKTNDYLQNRVASLQAEVRADEEKLGRTTRQAGVLVLDKDKTVALERLQGLQKQQLDAQEVRKNAEAQYNAASKPEALAALAEDSQARKYLDDTRLKIDELTKEREGLSVEFTDAAPEVKEIDRKIVSLTTAINDYREKSRNYLLTQYKIRYEQAKQQEDSITADYNRQYNQAQVQNEAGINLRLLQQNIDNKKGLLDNLFKQQRENDVVSVGSENNVSIIDPAVPDDTPVAPARLTTVIAAFGLSLAFGCGLALFLEYLDDTVRSPADVENILRLPALAVIPTVDSMPRRKLLLAGKNGEVQDRSELLISSDSRSALAEAYRQLRTSVLLSTAGHAPKSLLVTSSVPSEGKTTTAVNTAISLAQTGAKVLLIDADMRRPRLHAIFNISNDAGLSSILSSEMTDVEVLNTIQQDDATNLYLLPSGAVPPNPAELIGSEQMTRLFNLMEEHFAHVVVDSPPISSFTDGVLIASMVSGVLLVVHAGKSSRQIIRRSKQLLQDVGAKIFGIVLNNVNVKANGNGYYQSYYSSYYNDGE